MVSLEYLLHFIDEDAPSGDVTSEAVIPDICCRAEISAEQTGIIAGLCEATMLFSHYGVAVEQFAQDGQNVKAGDKLLSLTGDAKKILLVERTALNIIGRMSGIATRTREMADIISEKNPQCRVAGTRKTCPGFRALDKKAVQLGGGEPHRGSMSDGILIKDNHLALVPLKKAITAAKKITLYKKIEVEVETPADALLAASAGADIILLDNMNPGQVKTTLDALRKKGLRDRVLIELSGGIEPNTLRDFADLEVDVISMGALTHTVKNFSVTLEIVPG
ncbi:MAG: carboxylating nicotinate-nucleotide diphosphorylase [Methanoregula sp.]|nr:carboxylating nicotinate-nucleotide diphosphorylase [Methanoregula sp.]